MATSNELPLERLLDAITVKPRKLLNIPVPEIKAGSEANLTVFDPQLSWTPSEKEMKSRSKNNPFIGVTLKGRPLAVIANGQFRRCF